MTEKEKKELDDALLDLVNKGLIEVVEKGFTLSKRFRLRNKSDFDL